MQLSRGPRGLRPAPEGAAVTIGNFDGVHLGHRAVLAATRAAGGGLPVTAVCFEPAPREHLDPAGAPARLTRLAEKCGPLAAAGCDHLVVLRFDAAMAALGPEEFVARVLVEGLGARCVVIGEDFRFGHGRAGDLALLSRLGARHGFEVVAAPRFEHGGSRVSSTRVRAALAAGELEQARALLGRRYGFCGRVLPGDALGRKLGFPTANLPLRRAKAPLAGVFLARVHGAAAGPRWAAVSIGTRPTVGGKELRCEAHLLDFSGDLYGRRLEVELVARLRDELDLGSVEALKAQIGRDVEQARAFARERDESRKTKGES
jgi:riboflavin kinase/FMN adenylyltransferase